jgi:hypothetical protein
LYLLPPMDIAGQIRIDGKRSDKLSSLHIYLEKGGASNGGGRMVGGEIHESGHRTAFRYRSRVGLRSEAFLRERFKGAQTGTKGQFHPEGIAPGTYRLLTSVDADTDGRCTIRFLVSRKAASRADSSH